MVNRGTNQPHQKHHETVGAKTHINRMPGPREDRGLGPVERQTRDAGFSRVKGDGKLSMYTSGTRPCAVILALD
jgi:hypothetical protein